MKAARRGLEDGLKAFQNAVSDEMPKGAVILALIWSDDDVVFDAGSGELHVPGYRQQRPVKVFESWKEANEAGFDWMRRNPAVVGFFRIESSGR